MASIRGFSGFGLLALLLALIGALGVAPGLGLGRARIVEAIDLSPSCEPPRTRPAGAVTSDDSRLGALLRRARASGAERIRLFTDGCDVSGAAPASPGVPVDVVLRPRRDDVGILDLRVPDRIQPGVDFFVEILVGRTAVGRTAGPPADPISLSVSLLRDGARVGQARTLRLERRQTRRVRIRDRVDEQRLVRYRAFLTAPLGDPANDTREAIARVGDRPLILAVGAPVPGGGGFQVESLRPAEVADYLDDPRVRARVDAILVRGDLPARAQKGVAAAVREGAGLVALGGTGFAGEPLARVLPLTETPPEGRAALLLLDFSGSMQERKAELLDAVERLKEHFAPTDRVSFLAFRDVAVQRAPWTTVADARWDLRLLRPHGNTLLWPALQEAERMLGHVRGARRRVLVVSDGEWGDLDDPKLRRLIAALESAGIRMAALFVQEDVDPAARELFPVSLQAGADDLGAALLRLEDGAEDRTVREARAVLGNVPAWLAGAVPPPGVYRGFPRLYPRDAGEKIALRDGLIPLVGAWRRVGKVVVAAPADDRVDVGALLRACLREARGIRLTARRVGRGLRVEARGGAGAPFVIGGVEVAARPAGPDRWRAQVARVVAGAVQVACGDALLLVPPAAARELAGVTNCPRIAGDIARRTGGRLYEEAPPAAPAPAAPAVYVTLLAAALLVLASAWWRRRT